MSASTQCGIPNTISHILMEWPYSDKCQNFHGQGTLHDILGGDRYGFFYSIGVAVSV
jgi:hypothetical protein